MPKRACRGIDAIPANMLDTINPTPEPEPAKESKNEVVNLAITEKDDEVFSDGEDIENAPIPSAETSKKKRQYTEEHKEMLRQRLADMRDKQKKLREDKKAQNTASKTAPKKPEDVFDKKYKDEFDFLKSKIGEITNDINEIKTLKQQKAEAKLKIKADDAIIKEKQSPAPAKQSPAPTPAPAPAPAPEKFIPPINLSFRQRFSNLNSF